MQIPDLVCTSKPACMVLVTAVFNSLPDEKTFAQWQALDCLQVWGMLVEMRTDHVSGFDLSALNTFRWHPHYDKVELSK